VLPPGDCHLNGTDRARAAHAAAPIRVICRHPAAQALGARSARPACKSCRAVISARMPACAVANRRERRSWGLAQVSRRSRSRPSCSRRAAPIRAISDGEWRPKIALLYSPLRPKSGRTCPRGLGNPPELLKPPLHRGRRGGLDAPSAGHCPVGASTDRDPQGGRAQMTTSRRRRLWQWKGGTRRQGRAKPRTLPSATNTVTMRCRWASYMRYTRLA
jgi:hypothetical protein